MSGTLTPRKSHGLFSLGREPLAALRDEMEDLASRFLGEGHEGWFGSVMSPSVDLSETDKAVEVRMDLPGVNPKEIDIKLNNNLLSVSGEKKEEKEEKGRTYHRIERRSGSFSRAFTLPCSVAEDEVAAEYRDGVLKIVLPKTEKEQAKKISVSV